MEANLASMLESIYIIKQSLVSLYIQANLCSPLQFLSPKHFIERTIDVNLICSNQNST